MQICIERIEAFLLPGMALILFLGRNESPRLSQEERLVFALTERNNAKMDLLMHYDIGVYSIFFRFSGNGGLIHP